MPHAEINGAHIYYETRGQGRPLILSHGGWTDTSHWQPNLPALSRQWQVVVYDRRGCGRSTAPGDEHSYQLWRDDLYGLIQHLGLQRVYAGGCSYGAMLSLELALAYPQVVAVLVLESGTCEGLSGSGRRAGRSTSSNSSRRDFSRCAILRWLRSSSSLRMA